MTDREELPVSSTRALHNPQIAQASCPICRTSSASQRSPTPYWACPNCDLWFQDPPPPKLWHGDHEQPGDAMGEDEKGANQQLATWLFDHVLHAKESARPSKRVALTLDIGSHYPMLVRCLQDLGCRACAMDDTAESRVFADQLGVPHCKADFESWDDVLAGDPMHPDARQLSLITFVHSFEHLYDPLAALRKLRRLIADDGAVFIRMPDHRVPGYERDLTEGHFTIHPFFHTLTSVLQACVETRCFMVSEQFALTPGQRDLVLRPI